MNTTDSLRTEKITRLTLEQAVVIIAFTGISCGASMDQFHEYAEQKLRRPVLTHEMGEKEFWAELKEASREDFLALCFKKENSHEHN